MSEAVFVIIPIVVITSVIAGTYIFGKQIAWICGVQDQTDLAVQNIDIALQNIETVPDASVVICVLLTFRKLRSEVFYSAIFPTFNSKMIKIKEIKDDFYLIFSVFAGMIGTAFSVLIRLELSSPGVQFLQGDHQLFLILTCYLLALVFFNSAFHSQGWSILTLFSNRKNILIQLFKKGKKMNMETIKQIN